jgi:hypothetical protein
MVADGKLDEPLISTFHSIAHELAHKFVLFLLCLIICLLTDVINALAASSSLTMRLSASISPHSPRNTSSQWRVSFKPFSRKHRQCPSPLYLTLVSRSLLHRL